MQEKALLDKGPLRGYRALELEGWEGSLCGSFLADLGVDVIKVESPHGDPLRRVGPFYQDVCDIERGLPWLAYQLGKRGITVKLQNPEGAALLRRLTARSDFLIESYPPGYLQGLGLGYEELQKANPGLIMVSITPFGQSGPYRDYRASDLTLTALGGMSYYIGDPAGPPTRISAPQAALHASAHACAALLLALQYRARSGRGQYLDVSIQEALVRIRYWELRMWEYEGVVTRREGVLSRSATPFSQRQVWPCKDGYVGFRLSGGQTGRRLQPLVEWMKEEGMAGSLVEIQDWRTVDMAKLSVEEIRHREEICGRFF